MASHKVFHRLNINLTKHVYPIIVTSNGLQDVDFLKKYILSNQVLIVTNETVAPIYLPYLKRAYHLFQCDVVILPDGEKYKNLDSLRVVYDALIKNNHHRDTTIIALGGGVIGDLAGFAASTYQRGVPFIQIPTTLLAQVDAAVGGKTAINHPAGKNIIGSFYQPHAVLMDVNTLLTLPQREFCAGFAEITKYGLLVGGDFYSKLTQQLENGLLKPGSEYLSDCIAECCRIKALLVEKDEKDRGDRRLLNLGHTFAHALEAVTNFQRWLHGEAVAIGLYCAAILSYKLGDFPYAAVLKLEKLLKNAGLPHKIPKDICLAALRECMQLDKKIENNNLTFVLMKAEGLCYLNHTITETYLQETLTTAVDGD